MLEILKSPEIIVFVAAAVLAGIIWCVRLEGVLRQERAMRSIQVAGLKMEIDRQSEDIRRVRDRQDSTDHRVAGDLEAIKIQLAELNGLLKNMFHRD